MKGQGIALGPGSLFKRKESSDLRDKCRLLNEASHIPVETESHSVCLSYLFSLSARSFVDHLGKLSWDFFHERRLWRLDRRSSNKNISLRLLLLFEYIFKLMVCVVQTYCLLIFSKLYCYLNCTHRIVDERTEMCLCCKPASKVTVCFPSKTDEGA